MHAVDEVGEPRALPPQAGAATVAPQAAGTIHTDLARGFIRAEVIPFARVETATDVKQMKLLGRAELMGKEYVVQDGDILNIRFNV